jgi:hypothetical protein
VSAVPVQRVRQGVSARGGGEAVKTIWKYALPVTDVVDLSMPAGAHPLKVSAEIGLPCLWAVVDPSAMQEKRRFYIVGTGHPMPGGTLSYVGTFFVDFGNVLVFHVFDGGVVLS